MSTDIHALQRKYGNAQKIKVELPTLDFPPMRERRHGEVCMAILRTNKRFLLQTKESYPDQVMRLPSGGIKSGEDIEHALLREVWEETNLTVNVDRFVAQLQYGSGGDRSPFRTNLFFLRELSGELQSNDPSERISAWCEISADELLDYADKLCALDGEWSGWGAFRAASMRTLAEYCKRAEI